MRVPQRSFGLTGEVNSAPDNGVAATANSANRHR